MDSTKALDAFERLLTYGRRPEGAGTTFRFNDGGAFFLADVDANAIRTALSEQPAPDHAGLIERLQRLAIPACNEEEDTLLEAIAALSRVQEPVAVVDVSDIIRQVRADFAAAHEEICKLQGLEPSAHTWPEWSSIANTLRWFDKIEAAPNVAEPVAEWQVRGPDGEWLNEDADLIKRRRAQGYEVRALYATPPAPRPAPAAQWDAAQPAPVQEPVAAYDDTDPVMAALSLLLHDGYATDQQRASARAAMAEILRLRATPPAQWDAAQPAAEPTSDMIEAGHAAAVYQPYIGKPTRSSIAAIYRAMIAASPATSQEGGTE